MPRSIPLVVARVMAKIQAAEYKLLGDKARDELEYQPTIELEEAIQRAYDWFKEVGNISG